MEIGNKTLVTKEEKVEGIGTSYIIVANVTVRTDGKISRANGVINNRVTGESAGYLDYMKDGETMIRAYNGYKVSQLSGEVEEYITAVEASYASGVAGS